MCEESGVVSKKRWLLMAEFKIASSELPRESECDVKLGPGSLR